MCNCYFLLQAKLVNVLLHTCLVLPALFVGVIFIETIYFWGRISIGQMVLSFIHKYTQIATMY